MTYFNGTKSAYWKQEAAAIIRDLLDLHAPFGRPRPDAADVAAKLVEDAWAARPYVFDGRFGRRPNRLIAAAAALAHSVEKSDKVEEHALSCALCLGTILDDTDNAARDTRFSNIDRDILEKARDVYQSHAEKMRITPLGRQIDALLHPRSRASGM